MLATRPRPRRRATSAVLAPLGCLGFAFLIPGCSDPENRAVLESLEVVGGRTSPVTVRLEASGAVRVELFYDAGAGPVHVQELSGPNVTGNAVELRAGETAEVAWDFAAETGLDGGFRSDVRLLVFRGAEEIEGGDLVLDLGNDAPRVDEALPPAGAEVGDVVPIALTLVDSSSDAVSIRAEYDVLGDDPDAGWRLARPAGLAPEDPTPELALVDVVASPEGVVAEFAWSSAEDLPGVEEQVALRFTPFDPDVDGAPLATSPLRVDNNAEPVVELLEDSLLLNPDERRGIPLAYVVSDAEADDVQVLVQWRREGEAFPELPQDPGDLEQVLADPVLRREHRIATPYPPSVQTRPLETLGGTLRLPERALLEGGVSAADVVGATLELLRPEVPGPVAGSFTSPVAARILGAGEALLVLEESGRVSEVDPDTGSVLREVATVGSGIPTAMALEGSSGRTALVALDDAGLWRLERVELASGLVTEVAASPGAGPSAVRGLASRGEHSVLLTVGSSLVHVDDSDPTSPRITTLLDDLATPWGVVRDPVDPDRVLLAERDAPTSLGTGRILCLDLASHLRAPVVVRRRDLSAGQIDRPTELALAEGGASLLVAASRMSEYGLVSLDVGALGSNVALPLGERTPDPILSLHAGSDGSLLLVSGGGELLLGGGPGEQRRIVDHDPIDRSLVLDEPFSSAPGTGRLWRLRQGRSASSATERGGRFVWDSRRDVPEGGEVFLRIVGRDAELGPSAETSLAKRIRSELDVEPLSLPVGAEPSAVVVADVNGDGDLDLVSANRVGGDLSVVLQNAPGVFTAGPPYAVGMQPRDAAAADLDGDGDTDLVSANSGSDDLTVLYRSAGDYVAGPVLPVGLAPYALGIADVDGDGDLDLLSANHLGDDVSVLLQDAPGTWVAGPTLAVGDEPVALASSDVDLDGDVDLVVADFASGDLTLLEQVAPATFTARAPLAVGANPLDVDVADLDGDGDPDLVATSLGNDELSLLLQDDQGAFASGPVLGTGSDPSAVVALDADGDGDVDLVAANRSGNDLTPFVQVAPGEFLPGPGIAVGDGPAALVAADLDGDGGPDLVTANGLSGDLSVLLGTSAGDSTGEWTRQVLSTGNGVRDVISVDVDGDGLLDLVSTSQFSSSLPVHLQGPPGTLTPGPSLPAPRSPARVVPTDLDLDGDLDLAVSSSQDREIALLYQVTPGSFVAGTPVPYTLFGLGAFTASDLDGDGDEDLVVAHLDGFLTPIFQESPDVFSEGTPLAVGFYAVDVESADLDGDGDFDLVSAGLESESLTVLLQSTPGEFVFSQTLDSRNEPVDVSTWSLSGNDRLDLVSVNTLSGDFCVFSQEVPGVFAKTGGASTGAGPTSLAAADLDGDGDLDVAVTNSDDGTLSVFYGTRSGTFLPRPPIPVGGNPAVVIAPDLDGDGDPDIVVQSFFQGLTVLWGGR